jgi:diketogulonate reductase-like aldo/keto reductase
MESVVEQGLTRNIGVSNFNIRRLEKLMQQAKIKVRLGLSVDATF